MLTYHTRPKIWQVQVTPNLQPSLEPPLPKRASGGTSTGDCHSGLPCKKRRLSAASGDEGGMGGGAPRPAGDSSQVIDYLACCHLSEDSCLLFKAWISFPALYA